MGVRVEWNNRSLRTGGVCVRKKEHAWCVHGKQGSVCTADESLCLCMPCTARQHSSLCCCWAGPWLSFVGRQAGTRWIIFCLLLLLLPLPAFIFVAGPSPICQRQQQPDTAESWITSRFQEQYVVSYSTPSIHRP